jgi:catechol 2,3-dioxygenase-like lactoylglutathione lyase family enzyme
VLERLAPKSAKVSSQPESTIVSFRASTPPSSRTKRGMCFYFGRSAILCLAALFLLGLFRETGSAAKEHSRPRILGIAGVTIAAPSDTEGFYNKKLGITAASRECMGTCVSHLDLSSFQQLEILDRKQFDGLTQKLAGSNIVQITFETSELQALHSYLASLGIRCSEISKAGTDGANPLFWVVDPELHRIGFLQSKAPNHYVRSGSQVSAHLIHAGFVVRDRTAMEHFYKDILGFRPYWHGGMKDNQTDWISLQVPDGTDWVEFMVNVPLNADKRLQGVMNHIALGVPDIHAAAKQLLTNGMTLTEEPKIGRDGKWQLNLYDPDQTRVELMEFTPVRKPCCSDYTGPHPKL